MGCPLWLFEQVLFIRLQLRVCERGCGIRRLRCRNTPTGVAGISETETEGSVSAPAESCGGRSRGLGETASAGFPRLGVVEREGEVIVDGKAEEWVRCGERRRGRDCS